LAKANLDHTIITSPIDGIVTQRSVDVGQTVQASMTAPQLFVIAEDLTKMQVSANIDESDVGRLHPGQDATFRVDAWPGEDFHGTVAQIRLNPIVVNNVTTYATMVQVPNLDYRLKPGMTANLKIQVAKKTEALRVPNAGLRFRPSVDMFAALNQQVPPEAQPGRGGRGGGGGGGGNRNAGGGNGGGRGNGGAMASQSGAPTPGAAGASGASGASGAPSAADAGQAAGGRRGGRGGDPSRMMDRFQSMSPDQQKKFVSRMKDNGEDASAWEKLMAEGGKPKPGTAAAGEFVYKPRYGDPESAQQIDTLFTPPPTRESSARVWIFVDHQLKPVNIRVGITDGTFSELRSGELTEGMEVVTGVTGLGSTRATAAAGSGNPLMPAQRGGPPGGGPPGAGGRGR